MLQNQQVFFIGKRSRSSFIRQIEQGLILTDIAFAGIVPVWTDVVWTGAGTFADTNVVGPSLLG